MIGYLLILIAVTNSFRPCTGGQVYPVSAISIAGPIQVSTVNGTDVEGHAPGREGGQPEGDKLEEEEGLIEEEYPLEEEEEAEKEGKSAPVESDNKGVADGKHRRD